MLIIRTTLKCLWTCSLRNDLDKRRTVVQQAIVAYGECACWSNHDQQEFSRYEEEEKRMHKSILLCPFATCLIFLDLAA